MTTTNTGSEIVRNELIERARHGDREAFDVLILESIDGLYATARLIARDLDVAEDALQEALVRCWRDLPGLRDVGRFDGWLRRLLVNAVTDEFRKRRRFRDSVVVVALEPSVGDDADERAERDELERAFRRLSIEHRAVVVLYHYAGLSMDELAFSLGIPEGTAKSRLHYATRALRATLDSDARDQARREVSA